MNQNITSRQLLKDEECILFIILLKLHIYKAIVEILGQSASYLFESLKRQFCALGFRHGKILSGVTNLLVKKESIVKFLRGSNIKNLYVCPSGYL